MNIVKTLVGPKSKYDSSIPYTYEARIDPLDGQNDGDILEYFYSDTLCGLIEFLDDKHVNPKNVTLFALFGNEEIPIETGPMTENGEWLKRPKLCRSLEHHYRTSFEKQWKGHERHSNCQFRDREREIL